MTLYRPVHNHRWNTAQILLLDFNDQHATALLEHLRFHSLRTDGVLISARTWNQGFATLRRRYSFTSLRSTNVERLTADR